MYIFLFLMLHASCLVDYFLVSHSALLTITPSRLLYSPPQCHFTDVHFSGLCSLLFFSPRFPRAPYTRILRKKNESMSTFSSSHSSSNFYFFFLTRSLAHVESSTTRACAKVRKISHSGKEKKIRRYLLSGQVARRGRQQTSPVVRASFLSADERCSAMIAHGVWQKRQKKGIASRDEWGLFASAEASGLLLRPTQRFLFCSSSSFTPSYLPRLLSPSSRIPP